MKVAQAICLLKCQREDPTIRDNVYQPQVGLRSVASEKPSSMLSEQRRPSLGWELQKMLRAIPDQQACLRGVKGRCVAADLISHLRTGHFPLKWARFARLAILQVPDEGVLANPRNTGSQP